ncbi:MAG TPA: GGDEF domain-containing protein [Tepidisphaeraceae bacterium]|nr:GGDEF domain-containing protein [Tepidisphaeraceae bacterium]
MTRVDSPIETQTSDPHIAASRSSRTALLVCAGVCFIVSLAFGSWVLRNSSGSVVVGASLLMLVALIAVLMAAGFVSRELAYWRNPIHKLSKLVGELRAGEAPLADLDKVGGGAHLLIEPIRAVLYDLRDQRKRNAELTDEMRQRIMNRTDSLERQLGVMKAQASRDALTGLGNRRAFDQILVSAFDDAKSQRKDLSILMIDVDNFKPLNDTLGHPAGDELLRQIGQVIKGSMRDTDTGFRVGGDEFVILMPGADLEAGKRLSKRLEQLVDGLAMPLKLQYPPRLSIGVSSISATKATSPATLIEHVDKALYEVKNNRSTRLRRGAA